ncbi:MAG: hypothetical protein MJZ22_02955 [Candidatus Saccharibacteria bacterium]|nr:hypothetical protein [Candidatus Saccharibacteria bacterium]
MAKYFLSVIFVLTVLITVPIPLVNNLLAKEVAGDVREIKLPSDVVYVESFSQAGKFVGNGNGLQYIGGILIKSDLSAEALQDYYLQHGLECTVERQFDNSLKFDQGGISLKNKISGDDYYVVYTWGNKYCNSIIADLDIRGH